MISEDHKDRRWLSSGRLRSHELNFDMRVGGKCLLTAGDKSRASDRVPEMIASETLQKLWTIIASTLPGRDQ